MELSISIKVLKNSNKLRRKEEIEPFLQLAFSYSLDHDGTIWSVSIDKESESVVNLFTKKKLKKVTYHSGIAISLFSKLVISDYTRYEPLGGGFVFLKDLLENNVLALEIKDNSETTKKFVRMVLEIKLLDFKGITPLFDEEKNHKKIFNSILDRYDETFNEILKPTKPRYKRLHIRYHYPNITGIKTPASTFAIYLPPVCDPLFLEYHTRIACDMNGWSESDLIEVIEKQFKSKKYDKIFNIVCKIIAEALCLFANACDYVSDKSFESDVERFIDSFQCLSGDCEDLARVICYCCYILYFFDESKTKKDTLFYWLVKWMKLYVPGMTGGIANCPSLERDGFVSKENEIYHIYCSLIPLKYFEQVTNKENIKGQYYEWEDNLPLLILEGTNYSNALLNPIFHYTGKKIPHPTESIRKKIEKKYPSLAELSIQSQQEHYKVEHAHEIPENDFSGFYRRVLAFWSHNEKILDWSVGYGDQKKGNDENGYGVDFRDFVSKSEKISFIPSFIFKKDEFKLTLESIRKELPIRIDTVSKLSLIESKELSNLINNRTGFISVTNAKTLFPSFISYRLNHLKKLNPKLLESLRRCSEEYKIDYQIFPITKDNELYLIDIRIYV